MDRPVMLAGLFIGDIVSMCHAGLYKLRATLQFCHEELYPIHAV